MIHNQQMSDPAPELLETKPDTIFQPLTPRFLALTRMSLNVQRDRYIEWFLERGIYSA